MEKRIFILMTLLWMFSSNYLHAQFDAIRCGTPDFQQHVNLIKKATKPAVSACGQGDITYLKVNVHYFLKQEGLWGAPGNFTATDDGMGDTGYTGYDYSEDLIDRMNDNMAKNYQVALYPGAHDSPPAQAPQFLPKQVQYVLKGTYFHEVSQQIYSAYVVNPNAQVNWDILGDFGVNLGEEINIFCMETGYIGNGLAVTNPANAAMYLGGVWKTYHHPQGVNYNNARLANHEAGHILNLNHAFTSTVQCPTEIDPLMENTCFPGTPPSQCPCNPTDYDGCWQSKGNNLMSYVAVAGALTPCQVDIAIDGLADLSNYVEFCCDFWTVSPITCCNGDWDANPITPNTLLPGIKMNGCQVEVPCDGFDIIQVNCSGFAGGGDQKMKGDEKSLWPTYCFELSGDGAGSTCVEWTVTELDKVDGTPQYSTTFSGTDWIMYAPQGPNPLAHDIQVCATLCGSDCSDFTKCKVFDDYLDYFNPGDGDQFKLTNSGAKSNSQQLTVYPNPAKNIINLKYSGSTEGLGEIFILNNDGRKIKKLSVEKSLNDGINIDDLEAGVYYVMINLNSGKTIAEYFVKM